MPQCTWSENIDPNSESYKFITSDNDSIYSLAGPGTGKTFSIMRKVAKLIQEDNVDPKKILILTFTNASAEDIKNELQKLNVKDADKVKSSTLHSFCMKILHERNVFSYLRRNARPLRDFEKKPMLYDIATHNEFKNMSTAEKLLKDYESGWARFDSEMPFEKLNDFDELFQEEISKWLQYHQAITIGEIVPFILRYLRYNPLFIINYKYKYVLVDEYQDLNKAEQIIVDEIANDAKLIVVGDDNQSIYSFKNAHPEGIRNFPIKYKNCEEIKLTHCRRCPKNVVLLANELIINDSNYRHKEQNVLYPYETNEDGDIKVVQWNSPIEEAIGISNFIEKTLNENEETLMPSDFLVLSPKRKMALRIKNELNNKGIKCKDIAKKEEDIFGNNIIKRIFSYINLLANNDDLISFRYLLGNKENVSEFYSISYMKIFNNALETGKTIKEVFELIIKNEISIPRINNNSPIIKNYIDIKKELELWKNTATIDGFLNKLKIDLGENEDFFNRIENLTDIYNLLNEEAELNDEYLNYIINNIKETIEDPDINNDEYIRLITYHSAKGLSGKVVIATSCIEGLMPNIDNSKSNLTVQEYLDEQRRIFYVALTRCKYSKEGFKGCLVISSFANLSPREKRILKLSVRDYSDTAVSSSSFIGEIGEKLPEVQRDVLN